VSAGAAPAGGAVGVGEFTGENTAGGTIVRSCRERVGRRPGDRGPPRRRGVALEGHAKSLEELREKKLELLSRSPGPVQASELDRLLDKIEKLTRDVDERRPVSILLLEEGTGEVVPRISRGGRLDARPPVDRAQSGRGPRRPSCRTHRGRRAVQGKSILIQSVRSAMCTPSSERTRSVGILRGNLTRRTPSRTTDLKFLIARLARPRGDRELAALGADAARSTGGSKLPALASRPTSRKVIAQQQDAGRLPMKSDRRDFFSDIRASSPMSETMSPDNIATLLHGVLHRDGGGRVRHGGHARQVHG